MKKLIFVFGLLFFGSTRLVAVPVITYANGQVLQDAEGNIYNHRGELLIHKSGKMTYPSWLGGKVLRANEGWGSFPWRMYYPDGSVFVEYQYQIYYPMPPGATGTAKLFDGWSYTYPNGREILSNNWRDAQRVLYSNTVPAWNGSRIANENNQPINQARIFQPVGNSGYLLLELFPAANGITLRTSFVFDIFQSSYIYPIIFSNSNGLPETPFKKFSVAIETGYWGELVTVTVEGSSVVSRFESLPIPIPEPWPNPCTVAVLQHSSRPWSMRNRNDFPDFSRQPRRRR